MTADARTRASASMSTGRSAWRSAPIATSTAMSATRRSTRSASRAPSPPRSPRLRARVPGRTVTTIFFGGGTPSLMQPATVGAILDAIARALDGRARRRDHARGQPDQRRGDALPRLSARRASTACRSACRRWTMRRSGSSAGCTRRDEALAARRARARDLRALFVRPDLCAAGPDAGGLGGRARAAHRPGGRAPVALSADHRAGHAVLRCCTRPASSRCPTTTGARALRHDAGGVRGARPAGLRDLQSRAAGRRVPAQPRLLARAANMPASARARMAGSTSTAGASRPRPRSGRRPG